MPGTKKPQELPGAVAAVLGGSKLRARVLSPRCGIVKRLDKLYSSEYNTCMHSIKRTDEFTDWLEGLQDRMTRQRLNARLRKAMLGNLGDVKQVGDGVFEMRERFGPGWRMYYVQRGAVLIVMLGGGDKSTQSTDISKAIKLATTLEE
jgi:putative addiction module killer protein